MIRMQDFTHSECKERPSHGRHSGYYIQDGPDSITSFRQRDNAGALSTFVRNVGIMSRIKIMGFSRNDDTAGVLVWCGDCDAVLLDSDELTDSDGDSEVDLALVLAAADRRCPGATRGTTTS